MANKQFLAKLCIAVLGLALSDILVLPSAYAETEPVTVEVEFVSPVTITENNALQYGMLDENLAAFETVVIAPDGSVNDASGRVAGGTQAAADLTVTADATRVIEIQVGNISTTQTGYTLGMFMCNYNNEGDTACDGAPYSPAATVASATLRVGATLTGNGSAVAGFDNGSFEVTILYQ